MPPRPLRLHVPDRPPPWWGLFSRWLALSEPAAARLWHLVSTSRHPAIRAWKVTALYASAYAVRRDSAVALLAGPLKPSRVVDVLEHLVVEGKLSRKEATQMEEAILTQTTAAGAWT